MIKFEKIDILKDVFNKAYQSFNLQILGQSYNEDYQTAIRKVDYVTPFKDEFHNALYNSKKKRLKKYIEKVYYEDIVWLYISFSNLRNNYQTKSNLSFGQLANGEDNDLFNRIDKSGYGLGVLAHMIYSEAKKHGFNLKHYLQITLTDYSIGGQYKPLFQLQEIIQTPTLPNLPGQIPQPEKEADEIIKPDADQQEAEIILVEGNSIEKSTTLPEVINQSPNKKSKKDTTKSKTLFDIWIGDKSKYHEVIRLLKQDDREIKLPFIKDISGTLTWGKSPAKGWQSYLAAFISQCNENGFIDLSQYSNPEIMAICQNTFAIDNLNPDAFSRARDGSLDNKYITPFRLLPKALKNNANLQNH